MQNCLTVSVTLCACTVDCVVPESIHTPPWKVTGNSSGAGVLKAKLLEETNQAKLEMAGG